MNTTPTTPTAAAVDSNVVDSTVANNKAGISLAQLKQQALQASRVAGAPDLALSKHPNQKPSMPPHGTRRSMGKR